MISTDSLVDMIFHLKWQSEAAVHTDVYQASRINIWRDHLPPVLAEGLLGKEAGERLLVHLKDGEAVAAFSERKLFDVEGSRFDRRFNEGEITEPRQGRFYPQGMLRDIAGVFKANIQPFRCIGLNNGHLTVDLNHPLAGRELQLSVLIGKVGSKGVERGGTCIDWMETLTSGPGMQTRWHMQPTDFFTGDALRPTDEQPDELFYRKTRLVHHIDETARDVVENTYGRFLTDRMQVLDLMGSWQSHIPAKLHLDRLVGLGLNENELRKNTQLGDFLVHDLNADPNLPFESNTFDAVVNTASVEYLTDPLAVFNEVARILRPDGYFIVTFSNRWFQTKAIRIWHELHDFERMGLVLEYFLRTGGFKDLQTYSIRGLPRPHDDKYFPKLMFADPVYAVWGRKR